MAKKKNVVDQEVTQEKKKKGGTFLKICIALAIMSALILGGWIFTSSIIFLRNAILVAAVGGLGVGLARPVVKRISNAIAKSKENKRSRNRNRTRDIVRDKNRQNEQTLGAVPTHEAPVQEEVLDWQPITRNSNSSKKNR